MKKMEQYEILGRYLSWRDSLLELGADFDEITYVVRSYENNLHKLKKAIQKG